MLKLLSTVYEVAWQFTNLVYSFRLMFGQIIFTIAFRSLLTHQAPVVWKLAQVQVAGP